ncbi:LAFA_0B02388g1_1 [Lachancea sp. 'fantastica']|nr:LAFA_0B02388g1_1 [Lachancea sp. 'fantastica']
MVSRIWTICVLLVLRSCYAFALQTKPDHKDPDDFPFTTVVDILWQNVEFSTFLRHIQKRGDIDYLNDLNNFTILAPLNSAFLTDRETLHTDDYLLHDYVLNPLAVRVGTHILVTNDSVPHLLELKNDGALLLNAKPAIKEDQQPNMQNATIYSLSSLLPREQLFDELAKSIPQISYFSKLLGGLNHPDLKSLFDHRTVLIPNNDAMEREFNSVELAYLLNGDENADELLNSGKARRKHSTDREYLLKKLVLDGVFGGLQDPVKVRNLIGDLLFLTSHSNGSDIAVNSSVATLSNSIYKSGIAHVFPKLDFLSYGLNFTAEKYLIGLGAARFVEEVHMRKLSHLINGTFDEPLAIFVPAETSYDLPGYSKSSLLYHFVNADVSLIEEEYSNFSTKLYDSMFCSSNKRLGGKCQRLKVEMKNKSSGVEFIVNQKYRVKNNVPFRIGNTAIYLMEHEVVLPGDFLTAINPFSGCSKSLEFLRELNLLDLRPNNRGYTALLPCFKSWNTMELNLEYLEHNVTALNMIMKNYILNDLIYTDSELLSYETSNLYDEQVSATLQSGNESSVIELNLSSIAEPVKLRKGHDMFFDQGVIHPINEIYYPENLSISLQNLLEVTGSFDFVAYLRSFDSLKDIFDNSDEYSLLVPTALSMLLEDFDLNSGQLEEFLKLHVVFSNYTEALLGCEDGIKTLQGNELNCRESSSNAHLLRVAGGADKEVRILKKGCSSSGGHSCVFVIDRPISLSWIDKEGYKLRLPGTAFAMGAVIGIMFILGLLSCALVIFGRRQAGSKIRVDERTAVEEGLLPSHNRKQRTGYSSTARSVVSGRYTEPPDRLASDSEPAPFANLYSVNALREPVSIESNGNQNRPYN